ncbi:SDR family NAD(P)-dependent oxidoreductase [Rhodopirellula sp. P2]|uniref:SDR family NAD(P)-dependent oxidoreductase n=1 Tax=Rhodopirellula sp. P2 TaxID=2127060 RepID=UPI002367F5F3|nr:SDR family oxidoreductase [Rhodopirellula sp. P2]WDQ19105.1 SDR family oxidoreductase [Rhodopirellula sp. P2]
MAAQPIPSGIVVTGASSGIGRAIAIRLAESERAAQRHSRLLVHYCRNREGAESTAEAIRTRGQDAHIVAADLADSDDVHRLAQEAFEKLGSVQTWVNNAGLDVLTGEASDWSFDVKLQHLLAVDLQGTIALSRLVGARLQQQSIARAADDGVVPSMIFIGWDQAPLGMEGEAGMMFGPVKAAVMAFSASLAQTLAPHVRVNTVSPGWTQTAWGETTSGYWDDRAKHQSLMHRWGKPQDIAEAVAYLVAPENSFVTGQNINVNGGWNRRFVAPPTSDQSDL